jgi:hypothetical protein
MVEYVIIALVVAGGIGIWQLRARKKKPKPPKVVPKPPKKLIVERVF